MPISLSPTNLLKSRTPLLVALAGAALFLPCAATAQQPHAAQPHTGLTATINDYANGNNGDGVLSFGTMQASDGNFYFVGDNGSDILRVTPAAGDASGTLSTLAGQLAAPCGSDLYGTLIEASDGNLYGITTNGGTHGAGTFFQYVIATRTCTPLYNFDINTDGYGPQYNSNLTYGSDGNFYGVFYSYGPDNYGTAFRITPAGTFNLLYTFTNGTDGGRPSGQLIEATDGNWYGVASTGGSGANQGVFYKLTPGVTFPWVETPLYNIACTTGCTASGPMVEGADGMLYGSFYTGDIDGNGALFQTDFLGDFNDYYDFSSQEYPEGLFLGGDGNIYGSLQGYGNGSLYQVTTGTAVFTSLATFSAAPAPEGPQGPVLQASDGYFYGTAAGGGTKTYGALYQAVPSTPVPAPIKVTLSASTTNGSSPVTVSWKVLNATSNTYRNCYLYTQAGGGNFTGKATGTQAGAVLSGSSQVSPTSTGTYTYAVTCAGTESGISAPLTVTGIPAAATKTVLSITPNPISIGASGTLTATVTRTNGGAAVPGGSVSFEFEGEVLATINLASGTNGVAHYTASTAGLPPNTYPITAHYTPDSTDLASVSNTFNEVLKYPTTTTLSVTPGTIAVGANATITVNVTGPAGTGTPGGTVTIYADGGAVISNYPLTNGSATIVASTKGFPKATYQVTAGYNGSGTDNTSTSAAQSVTLN